MTSNYFTLAALAREWAPLLSGAFIRDVYSPLKDELTIELSAENGDQAIRISVRPGFHFVYRADRAGRPRTNVTTLFELAIGKRIELVVMNPTDRILTFRLGDALRIDVHLYGSRANIFLIRDEGDDARIVEAFKASDRHAGQDPPTAKSLPDADFRSTLSSESETTLERRLTRLRPRFGKVMIREVLFRSEIDASLSGPLSNDDADRVEAAMASVAADLGAPSPRLYVVEDSDLFSLIPLGHLAVEPDETFSSVDKAVRTVVRMRARSRRLEATQRPLVKALERALAKARRKVSDLDNARSSESRADDYERWAHLLMANPRMRIDGEFITVDDILGDGSEIDIPVKPDLSVIENAERYYTRARDLRTERATLEERSAEAEDDLRNLMRLLAEVASIEDPRQVERFEKVNAADLRPYIGGRTGGVLAPVPFRRFELAGGYEVWVGRNAKENDRLTFDRASPHDLWFHARGAAGSHVVLRVPGRKTVVPKEAQVRAARIAAWFSAARGSKLVPVIVTERKYVSKPKGSDPGAVRVHREDVLMVEPGLPG